MITKIWNINLRLNILPISGKYGVDSGTIFYSRFLWIIRHLLIFLRKSCQPLWFIIIIFSLFIIIFIILILQYNYQIYFFNTYLLPVPMFCDGTENANRQGASSTYGHAFSLRNIFFTTPSPPDKAMQ